MATAKQDGNRMRSREAGFTLVEIIITIVLVGILAGIAAMIITQAVRAYTGEQDRGDVQYQAQFALERMARELRSIRTPAETGSNVLGTITGNPANRFIFTDLSGTTISYGLTGTTLNRTVGGVPAPLAQGVTGLEFRHYTNANVLTTVPANLWFVEITMTVVRDTETVQMQTRVHPRNF
jgi:prepilin-type N-terminal cleavage/methylation domain-containing protein